MNASAHAGVTLKKKKKNNQTKEYSKAKNERVYRYCSFWISSIALLGWIFEIRKKKPKTKKEQKKTENRKNLH